MGGKAIESIINKESERITLDEKNFYLSIFKFPDFLPIREIGEKKDFGDIDLLINDLNGLYIYEEICKQNNIKINGKIKNSEITSYAINDAHQIDLIYIKDRNLAYDYYSDNDKGIIIGNIFHQLGFSYGHKGLYLKLESTKLLLSENTFQILSFLQYPKEQINKILNKNFIFETFNDMFSFCISTPFFNPSYYSDDYLNNENRTRNKKRKTWNAFKEFLKTQKFENIFLPNKEILKLQSLIFFNKEKEYIKLFYDAELNKVKKKLFDGNKISLLTGLTGKELGNFIFEFKEYIENKLNKSSDDNFIKYNLEYNNINNYIDTFFKKYRGIK
jgi:hypothetical protein